MTKKQQDDTEQKNETTEKKDAAQGTVADQDVTGTAPETNRNYEGETDTNAGR